MRRESTVPGILLGILLAFVLSGCGDVLYETPAPPGVPAVVTLNVQRAAQLQAVDPGVEAAFARVNQLQVVVSGQGGNLSETFAVSGSSGEIRASVEVPLQGESQQVTIQVELLGGGGVLFRGQTGVTLAPGQEVSPEIELSSVVGEIEIEPSVPEVLTFVGATLDLQARALFATGDPIDGVELAWTSLDPNVATVSSAGVVTATGSGTARIRAQGGGATGEVTVSVEPVPASVVVTPALLELPVGGEGTLEAVVRDAGGTEMAADVEWSSAGNSIATVSASGQVTGLNPGETLVQARAGDALGEATVRVASQPPQVETIGASGIGPDRASLLGEVNPFGLPTDAWFEWGRDPGLSDARMTARTSVGDGVSFVEVIQQITGLEEDTPYYLRVVAENDLGTSRGEIRSFRTTLFPVEQVTVEPAEVRFEPGRTTQLTAVARGADGRELDRSFTWTSADEAIARVSGDGTVEAVSPGETWVRAEAMGVSDSARVTVIPGPPDVETLEAAELTPDGATLRGTVNSGGFRAEARFEWGQEPDLSDARTTGVQVVEGTAGSVPVSERLEGLDDLTTYYFRLIASNEAGTVRGEVLSFRTPDVSVDRVTVEPAEAELEVGGTLLLSAQVLDADGNELERSVEWASSSAAVATVSEAGLVTGVAPGSVVISAGVDGVVGSARIEVFGGAPAVETLPAEGVEQERAVLVGQADGGGLSMRVWFEWGEHSSLAEPNMTEPEAVETGAGEVTVRTNLSGLDAGTRYYFRVVAASDAGTSRGEILTFVTPSVPVTRVSVQPGLSELNPGDSVQLTATAFDGSGNELDRDAEWVSVDPEVATVSATGLVTAQALGETQIRATVEGVDGTALVQVVAPPPTAETLAATGVESGAATLRGEVNGGGLPAQVFFRLGTDPQLQDVITLGAGEVPAGTGSTIVSEQVTNLAPDTQYWYEIVAITSVGEAEGGARSFRTAPIPVDRIEVDPESVAIAPGQTIQITATPLSADGEPLERELAWRSEDESVATVTQTGLVEGRDEGTTFIQVGTDGVTAQIPVEVRPGEPVVRTLEPTRVGERSAILRGAVDPGGADTRVRFRWGEDPELNRFETLIPEDGGTITVEEGAREVEGPLGELTGATRYYYRVVAENGFGLSLGEIVSFETDLSLPTPVLEDVEFFQPLRADYLLRVTFSRYTPETHPDAEFLLQVRRSGDQDWSRSRTTRPFTYGQSPSLQDLNLTAGIEYDFRLQAQRQGQFSEYSNVVGEVAPGYQPSSAQRFPAVHSTDLSQVTVFGLIQDGAWEAEYWWEFALTADMSSIAGQTPTQTISREDLVVLDAATSEGEGEVGELQRREHEVEATVGPNESWLQDRRTYYYRPVVRIPGDPDSESRGSVHSFTYGQPITAPAQVTASVSTATSGVLVTGIPNLEPSDGFLQVERRTNQGAWQFRDTLTIFGSTIGFEDTQVLTGRSYQYRIRGCRTDGGCSIFTESNVVQY